jgi:outer membrane lipoprotein-sorting protein
VLSLGLSCALSHASRGAAEPPRAPSKQTAPVRAKSPPKRAAVAPSEAKAPPLELSEVLARLARTDALSAHFHEDKRMALLAAPLRSEGTLYYEKPRLLARHTEKPRRTSLLLQGETLSFGEPEHTESIELSAQPALRVLVDTFVSVLAGDLAALTRVADLTIEALPEHGFRIRVTPKDQRVLRLVRSMSFEGQGALLTRMELLDANGDTTLTTFSDVALRKPFSAAERARFFKIGS